MRQRLSCAKCKKPVSQTSCHILFRAEHGLYRDLTETYYSDSAVRATRENFRNFGRSWASNLPRLIEMPVRLTEKVAREHTC
jgi:hypothetical protein